MGDYEEMGCLKISCGFNGSFFHFPNGGPTLLVGDHLEDEDEDEINFVEYLIKEHGYTAEQAEEEMDDFWHTYTPATGILRSLIGELCEKHKVDSVFDYEGDESMGVKRFLASIATPE